MGEVRHLTLIEAMGWYVQARCSCGWFGWFESSKSAIEKAGEHRGGQQVA